MFLCLAFDVPSALSPRLAFRGGCATRGVAQGPRFGGSGRPLPLPGSPRRPKPVGPITTNADEIPPRSVREPLNRSAVKGRPREVIFHLLRGTAMTCGRWSTSLTRHRGWFSPGTTRKHRFLPFAKSHQRPGNARRLPLRGTETSDPFIYGRIITSDAEGPASLFKATSTTVNRVCHNTLFAHRGMRRIPGGFTSRDHAVCAELSRPSNDQRTAADQSRIRRHVGPFPADPRRSPLQTRTVS